MENEIYTPEQIAADFEDIYGKPEYPVHREYYVVSLDLQEEDDDGLLIGTKFLSCLVRYDGAVIRTNIDEIAVVSRGRYVANFLITLPEDTIENFECDTGLELTSVSFNSENGN